MSETLTPIWKALADPKRRKILDLLKERPRTTGELSAAFEVSRYAVMKHLNVLTEAGLVALRRSGRERWNHLNAIPLQRIYERWLRPYEAEWADSMLALKRQAEEGARYKGDIQSMETNGKSRDWGAFSVAQDMLIEASPDRVFEALAQPEAWWSNRYYKSSKALHLELTVGGRFWEQFNEQGEGVLYAIVTYLKHGQRLELQGPMGMRGGVNGVISIELEPQGEATLFKLTHYAMGKLSEAQRQNYTEGWRALLGKHLKAFAEQGKRIEDQDIIGYAEVS